MLAGSRGWVRVPVAMLEEAVEVIAASGRLYYVYADPETPEGFRISAPSDYTDEEMATVRRAAAKAYATVSRAPFARE